MAHGRLLGVEGGNATFADDLAATLATAEGNAQRFRAAVDAATCASGLDVPAARPEPDPARIPDAPRELDLRTVGAVVWATGFRRDHGYIDADVVVDGEPVHHRGVTTAAGLYFLGLRWQHRRSSSFIDGVGGDAEYLAEHIARREVDELAVA